ncbi:MAG: precorrin-8X methylmutase, partial [Gemmataceae bacterium]|nr:precorrin-8X methylmutase [Gemmataceae bacterium]
APPGPTTSDIQASAATSPASAATAAGALPAASPAQSLPAMTDQRILEASFALIERELGPHHFPDWAFAVVRRMIHASADFDFAQTLKWSDDFAEAVAQALRQPITIAVDTEMVRVGIARHAARTANVSVVCYLNDPEAATLAAAAGLTRSAAGIRLVARRHPNPLLAIGNAPTALDEAVRLIEQEGWRPRAVVGMPVGFVGVEEAKSRLLAQRHVAYLSCVGRKGGSAVTAAALNALLEFWQSP